MIMKTPPLNYLIVEIATLLYPLFLWSQNKFPIFMMMIFLVHAYRLKQYWPYVNKNLQDNLQILIVFMVLLCISKNFIVLGILLGIFQYMTYVYHEQQNNITYQWIDYSLDIPITFISGMIAYHGFKTKNIFLAPFLGDFLYHILEFLTFNKLLN